MKNNYVVRAQKFIRQFYPFICNIDIGNNSCLNCFDSAVKAFNKIYNRHVYCANGAVRVTFITSDYAVKIDYNTLNRKFVGGCHEEYTNYQYVKENGYDYLFAEITPYEYCNITFYIMPKVNMCHYRVTFEDLMNYDEYDFVIRNFDDLHGGNWGTIHGKIKIVDYAMRIGYECDDSPSYYSDYDDDEEE